MSGEEGKGVVMEVGEICEKGDDFLELSMFERHIEVRFLFFSV